LQPFDEYEFNNSSHINKSNQNYIVLACTDTKSWGNRKYQSSNAWLTIQNHSNKSSDYRG